METEKFIEQLEDMQEKGMLDLNDAPDLPFTFNGIEANDVSSLLEQFEEHEASQCLDGEPWQHGIQKTFSESLDKCLPKGDKIKIGQALPATPSTEVLNKMKAAGKRKSAIFLPMGIPLIRGRNQEDSCSVNSTYPKSCRNQLITFGQPLPESNSGNLSVHSSNLCSSATFHAAEPYQVLIDQILPGLKEDKATVVSGNYFDPLLHHDYCCFPKHYFPKENFQYQNNLSSLISENVTDRRLEPNFHANSKEVRKRRFIIPKKKKTVSNSEGLCREPEASVHSVIGNKANTGFRDEVTCTAADCLVSTDAASRTSTDLSVQVENPTAVCTKVCPATTLHTQVAAVSSPVCEDKTMNGASASPANTTSARPPQAIVTDLIMTVGTKTCTAPETVSAASLETDASSPMSSQIEALLDQHCPADKQEDGCQTEKKLEVVKSNSKKSQTELKFDDCCEGEMDVGNGSQKGLESGNSFHSDALAEEYSWAETKSSFLKNQNGGGDSKKQQLQMTLAEKEPCCLDKVPSYLTTLSIPVKPQKGVLAGITADEKTVIDSLMDRDHSPSRESNLYNRVPAYFSCFTNSTKYDDKKTSAVKTDSYPWDQLRDEKMGLKHLISSMSPDSGKYSRSRSASRSSADSCCSLNRRRRRNYRKRSFSSSSEESDHSFRSYRSRSKDRSRSASASSSWSLSGSSSCSSSSSSSSCSSSSSNLTLRRKRSLSRYSTRSSRSRSHSRSRSRYQRSRHQSSHSRNGHRSRSRPRSRYSRRYRQCRKNRSCSSSSERLKQIEQKKKKEEKLRQMRERQIMYVGRIPNDYTKGQLQKRFEVFGKIENCSVHFRDHKDNYGFVTFSNSADVYRAIESGNIGQQQHFDLCFGGRRQFCTSEYADLDGNMEDEEEFALVIPKRSVVDFDELLKQAKQGICSKD